MKRICIYLTYDKQNIIDTYIGYMLKELRECAAHLVVICNGMQVCQGIENVETYADQIFFRENKGFDAGGFKDSLCNLLGWNKVLEYDELILVNDSIFGPFRPMREIFAEMDEKPVDFWGLAKAEYGACKENFGKDVPEHVQSYFIVVRSRMFHSSLFREYWEAMPYYEVFSDLFKEYEFKFTQYFAGLGYTYDALADTKANDSENINHNFCQYAAISYELIKKRNFPFLKKQQIAFDTLENQTQEHLRLAIEYIDQYTDYDSNLIWENIIRTLNIADLQRSLCLRYLISPGESQMKISRTVIIVVILNYEKSMEFVLEYLERLCVDYPIKIFSSQENILSQYRKRGFDCQILYQENSEFFWAFDSYDFVCVLHDEDISSEKRPSCTGKSCFYNRWENLLKDNHYVGEILRRFEEERWLGFLTYPQPVFAKYFGELGNGWNGNFVKTAKIVRELKLQCQLSETRAPFRVTNSFWIRGNILSRLGELTAISSQSLSYLWSYLAQDAGYYSGIVESEAYAAMNETNLQHYLQQIVGQIQKQYGMFNDFFSMKKLVFQGALQTFCRKHSRLLIYGTGYMARAYKDILPNVEGFLVSDGRNKIDVLEGLPVRYLSEITEWEKYGLVLCMDEKNQMQVISLLKKKGIENYIGI